MEQHNAHVFTWLVWRTSMYGASFIFVKADGTRTYLDPEDIYKRGTLEPKT